MKLTKSADYAFRLVVHLATEDTATMPYLASKLQIPYNNVMKLVSRLSRANILKTKQGKFGGVYLARSADTITMLDVVHAIDGPVSLSKCLSDSTFCNLTGDCTIKHSFMELQTMMNTYLMTKTIKQLKVSDKNRSMCHG